MQDTYSSLYVMFAFCVAVRGLSDFGLRLSDSSWSSLMQDTPAGHKVVQSCVALQEG